MDSEEPTTSPSGPDEPQSRPAESPRAEGGGRRPKGCFKLAVLALIALLFFAGLLALGILPRIKRQRKIMDASQAIKESVPTVDVITAEYAPATSELALPGNIEAIQTTPISARTNGYLCRWYADIGDRVKAGQLLAEIDTPEVDQQLQQTRANLSQAWASLDQAGANLNQALTNLEYTRVTYERWRYLASQHVVSDQDRDQTWEAYNAAKANVNAMQATVNVAKATIAANEADVRQLMALQGFKRVYAPFDGIITARNVEVGSLINAGSASNLSASTGGPSNLSASTGAPPSGVTIPGRGATQTSPGNPSAGGGLFQIARIDMLRIYINVPQTFSNSIKPGRKVEINVREFPEHKFTGLVSRTTSALDPASRTLLVEVRIANPDHKLLPGMYTTTRLSVALAEPPIRIPATALIIRADGPQVVKVTRDQQSHFQKVVIGRDFGHELDIISGIDAGDILIINVTDGLQDGQSVRAQPSQTGDQLTNQPQDRQPQKGQGREESGGKGNGNSVKGRRAFHGVVRRGDGAEPGNQTTNSGSGPK